MPPAPLRHLVLAWGSSGLHIPGAGGSATVGTNHCSLCLPLALCGHHLDWRTRGGGSVLWPIPEPAWYFPSPVSLLKLQLPLGKPSFSRTPISICSPSYSPSLSSLLAAPDSSPSLIPLNQSIRGCTVEGASHLDSNSSPKPGTNSNSSPPQPKEQVHLSGSGPGSMRGDFLCVCEAAFIFQTS